MTTGWGASHGGNKPAAAAEEQRVSRAYYWLQTAAVLLVAMLTLVRPVVSNFVRAPSVTVCAHHCYRRRSVEVIVIVRAVDDYGKPR